MKLDFEFIEKNISVGKWPDVINFANTQAQVFYINDGEMYGLPSDKINHGDWGPVNFNNELQISPDSYMTNFHVDILQGWGMFGSYLQNQENKHKLIIYEFEHEMDIFLEAASTIFSIDNPASSFRLNLINPDLKNPEHKGQFAMNEHRTIVMPGSKVTFYFTMGGQDYEYDLGTFYIDRSNFSTGSETVKIEGRNKIGKVLKDQTLDEVYEFWKDTITATLTLLLTNAGLEEDEFIIQNTDVESWFEFTPNTTYLQAIETIFETVPTWKIVEREDGTIIIGDPDFASFNEPGIYTFYRDYDIFSRDIVHEDEEVYRRVCVYTPDFEQTIYKEVSSYQGWNLQANKTLYVEVAEGATRRELNNYADELIERMSNVGKIETFHGPFRPYLQPGDGARIIDKEGMVDLGLMTGVTHEFGKDGYFTEFTVDSGGSIGLGRVSDYIKRLTGVEKKKARLGQTDIDPSEYVNIALESDIIVTSERSKRFSKDLLTDGLKYYEEYGDIGWQPHKDDTSPLIEIRFNKMCKFDKIMLWLDYDDLEDPEPSANPEWYRIQYWDSKKWVTLIEQTSGIDFEMTHTFDAIFTSKIRFRLEQKDLGTQNWREIEIWGNM